MYLWSFIHHPSSSAPQHQDPHSAGHTPSPSSIGRSICTPLLICSLAHLTPVCQSPSAVSTLLWSRVPREQQCPNRYPLPASSVAFGHTRTSLRGQQGMGLSDGGESPALEPASPGYRTITVSEKHRPHSPCSQRKDVEEAPVSAHGRFTDPLAGPAWTRIPSALAQSTRA